MDESQVSQEEIQQRAYYLWLARDRPLWDSQSDWNAAEVELQTEVEKSKLPFVAHMLRQVRNVMRRDVRAA